MSSTWKKSGPKTPCPICGRTSSGCRLHAGRDEDLIFCRLGTKTDPMQRHGPLNKGKTMTPDGWVVVDINEDEQTSTWKQHKEPVIINKATWSYRTVHDEVVNKTRTDWSSGKKEFHSGKYKLDELLPLYYETLEGLPDDEQVFIVEGEKCADAMRELGFNTIGMPGTTYKVRELERLRGKKLHWCPDRDRVGVEFMAKWQAEYGGKWLLAEPANNAAWRDPSDGFDLADWIPDLPDPQVLWTGLRDTAPELPIVPWHEKLNFGFDKVQKLEPSDLVLTLSSQLGETFKWNELTSCVETDGQHMEDLDMGNAYIDLSRSKLKVSKQQAVDALIYCARQNKYHPVRNYLDSLTECLPDAMWDNIGGEFLGGTPEQFDNSIVQRWLVHAVRRIYEPGSPFGVLLVLVGKQEAGKSRFFEELASRDWFNDGFKLSGKDADDIQSLTQTWIAEWGELDGGLKKTNEADIKAFVSRKNDRTREAYGTGTRERKRGFVLCGTTNKQSGFFSDETGNRRFALYDIGDGAIDGDKVVKYRDRIWASAVKAYRAGLSIHLSETERDIQRERNRLMFREDPWIVKIEQYLRNHPELKHVKASHLLHDEHCLGVPVDRSTSGDLNRVRIALASLGWQDGRKNIDGKRARVFMRPS